MGYYFASEALKALFVNNKTIDFIGTSKEFTPAYCPLFTWNKYAVILGTNWQYSKTLLKAIIKHQWIFKVEVCKKCESCLKMMLGIYSVNKLTKCILFFFRIIPLYLCCQCRLSQVIDVVRKQNLKDRDNFLFQSIKHAYLKHFCLVFIVSKTI